ncbi:hypothetical protein VOLCADRAFT_98043 [Volvox carteri f. nagariensis]|uniref:ALA-interacting subunit n=1 Tax=Volvox carteri f. nagariensis TaxID=3068 RepID=D8UEA6_VOLCA|nr:uncharacterized protein VOLCADRAFT_98043 [Volvox carteri f. nagariensis]EFJ41970.1 hypothetical protein VOLCADRAFT_98043 [Volvox carteri f. nagariensis]|eukprot:XP_002957007.1 hypothetical protein VOLCADRAFT_98043 [Volvox carteri f. nagariensis]
MQLKVVKAAAAAARAQFKSVPAHAPQEHRRNTSSSVQDEQTIPQRRSTAPGSPFQRTTNTTTAATTNTSATTTNNNTDPRASTREPVGPLQSRSVTGGGGGGGGGFHRCRGDPHGGALRRFREQTYDVFRPQTTLPGALAVLGVLFALGLGLGVPLLVASLRVVEVRARPIHRRLDPQATLWASGDAGVRQILTLTIPRTMRPPIYMLYEIEGLYGTHKRYIRSINWEQLSGQQMPASSLEIATSLFNDTFTLEADSATCGKAATAATDTAARATGSSSGASGTTVFAPLALDEHGILWPLVARNLYGMYNATNLNSVPAFRTGGSLNQPVGMAGHFQVWMQASARPTAAKLYGTLNEQLPAGCVLRLHVANRYNSYGWGGAKNVVLTTQSWYGMRNLVLPCVLLAVAAGALGGAALLLGLGTCLKRNG